MIIGFFKKYIVLILCMVCIALAPFIFLYIRNGFHSPKVPVEMTDDSLYYFGRAVEVSQGHPFIGNQYIFEHRDDPTVSFFVADWIYAAPLFLGASIQQAIIIDQVVWFVIFGLLLTVLIGLFQPDKPDRRVQLFVTIGIVLSVYWFEARPVAMQVVYPVFLFFLITFIYFLRTPDSKKSRVALAISTTFSLYVYTYLTQIVAVILILCFAASFFKKYSHFRGIFWSGLLACVLSIPFVIYTWTQIHAPFYFETLARIGLVHTHLFGTAAVWYVLLALLPICIAYYVWEKDQKFFAYLVSFGLIITTLSNVITGSDLEVAVHIGRFTELWSVLFFINTCVRAQAFSRNKRVLLILIGILFLCVIKNISVQITNTLYFIRHPAFHEEYAVPLAWLRDNTPPESVVFTDDMLAGYVPVTTDDYVFFYQNAELYLMSDQEVASRFVASRMFESLSVQDIEDSYRKFGGAGHAAHVANVHNRAVTVCNILHLSLVGKECGQSTTALEMATAQYGTHYFSDLQVEHDRIAQDPLTFLQQYKVRYIVVDQEDHWSLPTSIENEKVWSNGRFSIYMLQ